MPLVCYYCEKTLSSLDEKHDLEDCKAYLSEQELKKRFEIKRKRAARTHSPTPPNGRSNNDGKEPI